MKPARSPRRDCNSRRTSAIVSDGGVAGGFSGSLAAGRACSAGGGAVSWGLSGVGRGVYAGRAGAARCTRIGRATSTASSWMTSTTSTTSIVSEGIGGRLMRGCGGFGAGRCGGGVGRRAAGGGKGRAAGFERRAGALGVRLFLSFLPNRPPNTANAATTRYTMSPGSKLSARRSMVVIVTHTIAADYLAGGFPSWASGSSPAICLRIAVSAWMFWKR